MSLVGIHTDVRQPSLVYKVEHVVVVATDEDPTPWNDPIPLFEDMFEEKLQEYRFSDVTWLDVSGNHVPIRRSR